VAQAASVVPPRTLRPFALDVQDLRVNAPYQSVQSTHPPVNASET
jgi:hypothetical protein